MSPAALVALAIAGVFLLAAILVVGLRLFQQQLVEVRSRLEAMAVAQQEVPKALADGRAQQAEVLVQHLQTLQTAVGQRLDETGRAVADVRERLGELGQVAKRLEKVGETVTEVQELLRVPRLRGTLGEVWLEELLRQILPASLFEMQHTFRSGERVDAVIKLGDGLVPVDAKFPLEACQRMLAATGNNAERERRTFVRSVRARIDEIADKYIRPDEGTYEFALMYIPAENVYYEAIMRGEDGEEKGVLTYAVERKVIPVSPHTFYAYLLVIVHGLKGMKVEERAREILGELGGLRQQFDAFWTVYEKVGAHLANAQKQYAESEKQKGKLQGRFERIGAVEGSEPELPAVGPAEQAESESAS